MSARRRLRRMLARANNKTAPFPLPEGKSEFYNYRGEQRRYNSQTGKYDLKV